MSKFSIKTARGVASFRRAGLEFGREPIVIDDEKVSKKRFAAIQAEPRLEVAAVDPADSESDDPMQDLAKETVAAIAEAVPGLSDDELQSLVEHEQQRKNRQGVMNVIYAERLKRGGVSESGAKPDDDAE